jgi:hypothetical protein
MPPIRCFYRDKNGVRCRRVAREGSNYCVKHKPKPGPDTPALRRKLAMRKKALRKK